MSGQRPAWRSWAEASMKVIHHINLPDTTYTLCRYVCTMSPGLLQRYKHIHLFKEFYQGQRLHFLRLFTWSNGYIFFAPFEEKAPTFGQTYSPLKNFSSHSLNRELLERESSAERSLNILSTDAHFSPVATNCMLLIFWKLSLRPQQPLSRGAERL